MSVVTMTKRYTHSGNLHMLPHFTPIIITMFQLRTLQIRKLICPMSINKGCLLHNLYVLITKVLLFPLFHTASYCLLEVPPTSYMEQLPKGFLYSVLFLERTKIPLNSDKGPLQDDPDHQSETPSKSHIKYTDNCKRYAPQLPSSGSWLLSFPRTLLC